MKIFQFQRGAIGSPITCYLSHIVPLFQFQRGAIGRIMKDTFFFTHDLFQFQRGAIGRINAVWNNINWSYFNSSVVRLGAYWLTAAAYRCLISIPAWCDWEFCALSRRLCFLVISIPAWCDWEGWPLRSAEKIQAFQFQRGAIGSLPRY